MICDVVQSVYKLGFNFAGFLLFGFICVASLLLTLCSQMIYVIFDITLNLATNLFRDLCCLLHDKKSKLPFVNLSKNDS